MQALKIAFKTIKMECKSSFGVIYVIQKQT